MSLCSPACRAVPTPLEVEQGGQLWNRAGSASGWRLVFASPGVPSCLNPAPSCGRDGSMEVSRRGHAVRRLSRRHFPLGPCWLILCRLHYSAGVTPTRAAVSCQPATIQVSLPCGSADKSPLPRYALWPPRVGQPSGCHRPALQAPGNSDGRVMLRVGVSDPRQGEGRRRRQAVGVVNEQALRGSLSDVDHLEGARRWVRHATL